MAGADGSTVYRNLTSTDTTSYTVGTYVWPTVESLGWSKEGYYFVEWNSNRNGTGTSYQVGATAVAGSIAYAIWAEDTTYTTKLTELTSIADAIRTKGGTSAALEYPADFVSAIGAISGSSFTLLSSQDQTVNTSSTSETSLTTLAVGASAYTAANIIYVKIRDKNGPRAGYCIGSDAFFFNNYAANGATDHLTYPATAAHMLNTSNKFNTRFFGGGSASNPYGIYPTYINSSGNIQIVTRFNRSYSGTLNGTYNIEVYALGYAPNQGNPFNYSYS